MEIGNTLYVKTRQEWRSWLEENFDKEKDIWLILPNKITGKPSLLYNDAVEEALCFGWIDSIIKSFKKDHRVQRYSQRKPKSQWSQPNKERIRWLMEQDQIHPSELDRARKVLSEEFVFPQDILDILRKDEPLWKHYQSFSESYQRIRIAWIDGARSHPEIFEQRLQNFLKLTKEGKQVRGFGGIDKYY